jgi:hypothetical protein
MSWFDGVLGNASRVTDGEAQKEFSGILSPGEKVIASYKLVRDYVVFTELRLIMVDKQGITGKKVEYHSMPYKSISHFAVETAGTFDLDAELKGLGRSQRHADRTQVQQTGEHLRGAKHPR